MSLPLSSRLRLDELADAVNHPRAADLTGGLSPASLHLQKMPRLAVRGLASKQWVGVPLLPFFSLPHTLLLDAAAETRFPMQAVTIGRRSPVLPLLLLPSLDPKGS